jgi:uncharacterized protein
MSRASLPRSHYALIDTSAYFALFDARDDNHEAARAIWTQFASEHWRTVTTNFLIAEAHALLLTRLGRESAIRFLDQFERSTTTVVRISAADERRGREIIHEYEDKDFSLTDATSFSVMERLRIGYGFTFDRHFSQNGFASPVPANARRR